MRSNKPTVNKVLAMIWLLVASNQSLADIYSDIYDHGSIPGDFGIYGWDSQIYLGGLAGASSFVEIGTSHQTEYVYSSVQVTNSGYIPDPNTPPYFDEYQIRASSSIIYRYSISQTGLFEDTNIQYIPIELDYSVRASFEIASPGTYITEPFFSNASAVVTVSPGHLSPISAEAQVQASENSSETINETGTIHFDSYLSGFLIELHSSVLIAGSNEPNNRDSLIMEAYADPIVRIDEEWEYARYFELQSSIANSTFFVSEGQVIGDVTPVPIPGAAWLFGSALIGLFGFQYRRK